MSSKEKENFKELQINQSFSLDDPSFSVEACYSRGRSVEEKMSIILSLLSSINGLPAITETLNRLKLQKSNSLSLYNLLSSSVRSELLNILEELFELKLSSAKMEKKMDTLLYAARVTVPTTKSSLSSLDNLPHSHEYRQFLSMYSDNMVFIKRIVELKSRISLLLDSQKTLDKGYASKMAQIDYQIISLGKIMTNFHESSKVEVSEIYMHQFNQLENLIKDITENEEKFNKLRLSLNLNPESYIYSGFKDDILNQVGFSNSER